MHQAMHDHDDGASLAAGLLGAAGKYASHGYKAGKCASTGYKAGRDVSEKGATLHRLFRRGALRPKL